MSESILTSEWRQYDARNNLKPQQERDTQLKRHRCLTAQPAVNTSAWLQSYLRNLTEDRLDTKAVPLFKR
jgi:hypothetical protein